MVFYTAQSTTDYHTFIPLPLLASRMDWHVVNGFFSADKIGKLAFSPAIFITRYDAVHNKTGD